MAIFFWKKNKQIDLFAKTMADELYSEIQPQMMAEYFAREQGKKPDKLVKKVDRRLREIVAAIQQFRYVNGLGVYGKARLHLTFTERLKELGYNPAIAKQLNENILIKTP